MVRGLWVVKTRSWMGWVGLHWPSLAVVGLHWPLLIVLEGPVMRTKNELGLN
jgi:hypothetical protein